MMKLLYLQIPTKITKGDAQNENNGQGYVQGE